MAGGGARLRLKKNPLILYLPKKIKDYIHAALGSPPRYSTYVALDGKWKNLLYRYLICSISTYSTVPNKRTVRVCYPKNF